MNIMINIENAISMIINSEKTEVHEEIRDTRDLMTIFDNVVEEIHQELGIYPSRQNYSITDGVKTFLTYIIPGTEEKINLLYNKDAENEDIFAYGLGCKIYVTKPDSDHVMVNGVVPVFAIQ